MLLSISVLLLGTERGAAPLFSGGGLSYFFAPITIIASVKVEEPDNKLPTAQPIPLQLKFYNWGQGGKSFYFHGTQVLETNLPYHGNIFFVNEIWQ